MSLLADRLGTGHKLACVDRVSLWVHAQAPWQEVEMGVILASRKAGQSPTPLA